MRQRTTLEQILVNRALANIQREAPSQVDDPNAIIEALRDELEDCKQTFAVALQQMQQASILLDVMQNLISVCTEKIKEMDRQLGCHAAIIGPLLGRDVRLSGRPFETLAAYRRTALQYALKAAQTPEEEAKAQAFVKNMFEQLEAELRRELAEGQFGETSTEFVN